MNISTRKLFRLIIFTFIPLTLAPLTNAQDFQNTDKPAMEDMVVTATRTEERPIDVPVNTEVITREMIDRSAATHLGDLLSRYITGRYVKYGDLGAYVGLRKGTTGSFNSDIEGDVLILVDGHRIGTGNAAKISLDRIDRIEVTKGPVSALYGSSALDGIINLITKKGDGDLATTISGDVGSFDYQKGLIKSGGEISDRFKVDLAASYEDIYDHYDNKGSNSLYTSGISKENIGGNFSYALTEQHEVRLGGNYANLTSNSSDMSHGYTDLEYNGDFFEEQLHWRGLLYALWDLNLWEKNTPDQAKDTGTTWGIDQQFSWQATGWNTLTAGFSADKIETKREKYYEDQPAVPYTPNLEYNSGALFAQEAVDLWNNRVNLIAAARYDRFKVKTKPPETGDIPDFNARSETFDHLSPKLGIGVKFLKEMLRIRANAGEGFKSPKADELAADYELEGIRYEGNPDLKPEISQTYDLGVDIFHDLFTLNAGYFHTDYKDKISLIDLSDSTKSWENQGKDELAGVDLNLEWEISQTFGWEMDLSLWSKATFNTTKKDKQTDKKLRYIPDYEVKSGLNLNHNHFNSQISYVRVGPQIIEVYDEETMDQLYVGEKSSFDFWDLTLGYQFKTHWQVRAIVSNLFDEKIEWVESYMDSYMDPARNYRIGVSYTF
jgi:vitamin B12 transporter